MTAPLTPLAARRRFVAVSFLFWLPVGLWIPSKVLLLTERGVSVSTIAALFAVHSFTVAALELPTGGLSDVLGRRPVLAAAGVLNLTAFVLEATGTATWIFAVAMVLLGAGRALSSGPAEAWYVDTVHAHSGPDAELRTGLAHGGTGEALGLALGTVLGGGLPWLLGLGSDPGAWLTEATGRLVLPLSVPGLVGAVLLLAFVGFVLTALPEPPRLRASLRDVLAGVPGTMLGGLRLARREPLIRRVLLTAAAIGTALVTIELLAPGRAAALTGSSASGGLLFATLACAGFLGTALGTSGAPALARLAGSGERAVLASLLASSAGLLLLGITLLWSGPAALALAATGYLLVYVGLGAAGPSENDLLHRRVDSAGRATALSVQSLAMQACGALGGLAAGSLPAGPARWLPAGAALLLGALLWLRRARGRSPLPTAGPMALEVAAGRANAGEELGS